MINMRSTSAVKSSTLTVKTISSNWHHQLEPKYTRTTVSHARKTYQATNNQRITATFADQELVKGACTRWEVSRAIWMRLTHRRTKTTLCIPLCLAPKITWTQSLDRLSPSRVNHQVWSSAQSVRTRKVRPPNVTLKWAKCAKFVTESSSCGAPTTCIRSKWRASKKPCSKTRFMPPRSKLNSKTRNWWTSKCRRNTKIKKTLSARTRLNTPSRSITFKLRTKC